MTGGLLAEAEAAVAAASTRARVDVRELTTLTELQRAESLLSDIWGRPRDAPTVPSDLLRAFSTTGNYVAGAWRGDELIAAAAGIHGRRETGVYLYSVVAGVHAGHQTRHVGFALKQHQRAWALARELELITWTFDPLVRRNAYFNLAKLGAEVTGYHEDFYGPMHDALNRGDESDRCLVSWHLAGARARAAATGTPRPEPTDAARTDAARILVAGPAGEPVATVVAGPAGDVLLAWVPEDIAAMRADDPAQARAWRAAARDTLGRALAGGYAAVDMLRSGWYVLEPRR
ncbi:MAG: GNAT family N-acetyltransferase [Actinobacteria bacterium]|nr:MAG: GNAT family N-acetyltransferase [Actinomycetota bacterium]